MVASRERQHGGRVPHVRKYKTKVLPIAVLYGGNASGKSNFFKALRFAQNLIVMGTQPGGLVPVEPFRLDAASSEQPSKFRFELLIDEKIYEYSFAVTHKAVLEEKLVFITSIRFNSYTIGSRARSSDRIASSVFGYLCRRVKKRLRD